MDIQKTMEFILEQQVSVEERLNRMTAVQQRTDRRVEAIAKLVQTGMKMLVRLEKTQQELAEAQKETDRQIKALLKRSTNGRK